MSNSSGIGLEQKIPISHNTRVRAVVAGSIGNFMEWFDYGIYGTFASIIATIFFPVKNSITGLLLTFIVFGVGFVLRPAGSFIFGYYGDKLGRKAALSFSIILMAVCSGVIGILPSYQTIGIAAPILLTLARVLQGISTGGEWGGSTSFLVEYATENKRGLYGSWQQFSTMVGFMGGSLFGVILTNTLNNTDLYAWGWRIPFLFGAVLGIVGLYMRLKLDETPAFQAVEKSNEITKNPLTEVVRTNGKQMLKMMGMTIIWTVSVYTLISFMPSFTNKMLKLPLNQALLAQFLAMLVLVILIPIIGAISDKVGRKPFVLISAAGFAIVTYPLFSFASHGGFARIFIMELVLIIFLSMYSGVGVAYQAELFPTKLRYSASVGYNIMIAIFGGMAPFINTFLISVTKSNISPAYYVIGAAVVSFIVMLSIEETFNKPLK